MQTREDPLWRVPARVMTTGWVQVRATSERAARRKVLMMLSGARQPELRLDGMFGAPVVEVSSRFAIVQVPEAPRPEEDEA